MGLVLPHKAGVPVPMGTPAPVLSSERSELPAPQANFFIIKKWMKNN